MTLVSAPLHRQIESELQDIEVWSAMAIPSFKVVGLPGQEIVESCERVRAAIEASGMEFPRRRVLVNLSPAGVRKQGTGTDLAIAIAVMLSSMKHSGAMDLLPEGPSGRESRPTTQDGHAPRKIIASGELALDGSVRSAGRILRACHAAALSGATDLVLAAEDSQTAERGMALIAEARGQCSALRIHFIRRLEEVLPILEAASSGKFDPPEGRALRPDFRPMQSSASPSALSSGPASARARALDLLPLDPSLERVILTAAAGAHHLLLLGPKGTGKTASLHWLQALQARLSPAELLDRLLLEELVDPSPPAFEQRAPLRILPPQIRPEALVGGFHRGELRPGEFSQAHGGTLVADEFLEWPRDSRECLRDPMESGRVHLARAQRSLEIPARFQLAASANLCRCGGWPRAWSRSRDQLAGGRPALCSCPEFSRNDYLSRLSGPILDRIDLVKLVLARPAPASSPDGARPELLAEKTERCRDMLVKLWGALPGRLEAARIEEILRQEPALALEWSALRRPSEVSLRRRHKEIRVALTLSCSDFLEGRLARPVPGRGQLEEARQSSADDWLPTLSRTELRARSPAKSHVDPPAAPV